MKKERKNIKRLLKKNKALKRQKKAEKEKQDKAELWTQLKATNKEFKKINEALKSFKNVKNNIKINSK